MTTAVKQIKVAIGTIELTDTDRRAIAWWILDASGYGGLATHDACRKFLRKHGEHGVMQIVAAYLNAGGETASME